jgi:hypothetical protein
MFEPGSTGFSVVSGVIDGVFRLAGDPTNLALMYGAGVKTAMRTMVQANKQSKNAATFFKSFVPGKTGKFNRAAFYGRTVDDVRNTGWGQSFGKAIAQLKGDEGMAFLNDIKEFDNIPASVKEVLLHVDDPIDVWDILDIVAKNGNLTGKEFDNMFNLIKKYVSDDVGKNLDRVREASVENIAFGLNNIPARPTAMGELFNYANKLMTGKSTDVAPMRKFAGLLLSKDDPARGLLGTGTQLARTKLFPRHVKRAMQLRPETIMVIDDLEAASRNANDMLKLSFASAKERGYYSRLVLTATSQKELEDIAYQINQAIAKNVSDYNPNLKIDVEDIMKQQESYNAQMNELRDFFGNSAGGSIAFNGTQIKKRYKKLIKDVD